MPFGISIKTSKAAGVRLWELWAEFSQLEETPSMLALSYPPHVALAVYDSIPEDQLCDALHFALGTLSPFRLKFSRHLMLSSIEPTAWNSIPSVLLTNAP